MNDAAQNRAAIFIARVAGPMLLILALALILRRGEFVAATVGLLADPGATLIVALVALTLGLSMVVAHNRWRGPTAIIVSVLGWATTLRGVLLLVFPAPVSKIATAALDFPLFPLGAALACILLGGYLTFAGYFSKDRTS